MITVLDAPVSWQRQLLKIDCMRNKILTQGSQIIRSKIQDFFQTCFEKQQFTSKIEWDLTTEKNNASALAVPLKKNSRFFITFPNFFKNSRIWTNPADICKR